MATDYFNVEKKYIYINLVKASFSNAVRADYEISLLSFSDSHCIMVNAIMTCRIAANRE